MSATQIEGTPPGTPAGDLRLMLPGRIEPAGAGWTWIVEGWRLFAKAPLMWVASMIVLFIIAVAMSFIPVVGDLAFQLVSPIFAAGFVVACRALERGEDFELGHLFAGFTTRLYPLLIVALVTLLGWIAILLVFAAFAGFSILTALLTGETGSMVAAASASLLTLTLGFLVAGALAVPLTAAYWFAPALVVMHDVPPLPAMKASFLGCFRNFIPFLVYGFVMMVLAFATILTLGLGLLVWLPLAVASTYAAYRRIFTEGPGEAGG